MKVSSNKRQTRSRTYCVILRDYAMKVSSNMRLTQGWNFRFSLRAYHAIKIQLKSKLFVSNFTTRMISLNPLSLFLPFHPPQEHLYTSSPFSEPLSTDIVYRPPAGEVSVGGITMTGQDHILYFVSPILVTVLAALIVGIILLYRRWIQKVSCDLNRSLSFRDSFRLLKI